MGKEEIEQDMTDIDQRIISAVSEQEYPTKSTVISYCKNKYEMWTVNTQDIEHRIEHLIETNRLHKTANNTIKEGSR